MNEKEKVIQQINDIKHHLVDKEVFFPYNYNACHIWSVITVILTLIIIPIYSYDITVGFVTLFVLISFGFVAEGLMTKKVNQSYDINDCTKRQQFIMKNFLMLSLFSIAISTILASYSLYSLMLIVWIFTISIGFFAISFALNIKLYAKISQFNIIIALALLTVGLHWSLFEYQSFVYVVQGFTLLCLAVLPTYLAIVQKKRQKCLIH